MRSYCFISNGIKCALNGRTILEVDISIILTSEYKLIVLGFSAYKSLWDGLKRTYKVEGIRGLYKGIVPGLFGVSHGALQFMAYEEMKRSWSEGNSKSLVRSSITQFKYLMFKNRVLFKYRAWRFLQRCLQQFAPILTKW
jgi:hypothetical protein